MGVQEGGRRRGGLRGLLRGALQEAVRADDVRLRVRVPGGRTLRGAAEERLVERPRRRPGQRGERLGGKRGKGSADGGMVFVWMYAKFKFLGGFVCLKIRVEEIGSLHIISF